MKIKLEFMLPNMETAYQARKEVLAASVDDKYIHFLAKPGTDLGSLQLATAFEGTNLMHEGERGVLYGAGFGLLAGLYVLKFPPWLTVSPAWYASSPWYVILAITIFVGAISVAIGAALLGVNIFNTDLNVHKYRINNGEILMIVTVPFYRVKKIRKVMNRFCQLR
ncbi:MAG: hypothetical protein Q8S55_12290 [Methylococcaceae bacterium]|nr:hypothetical protein [Methylococcaceae bacterium]